MPTLTAYDYAILRVVPRVEREEFMNVGVVLHSYEPAVLATGCALDVQRLAAFAPDLDPRLVHEHLVAAERICRGDADAGPIARLPPRERFLWVTSPRSTILQPSPVHVGLCTDPKTALAHLLETMVRAPSRP